MQAMALGVPAAIVLSGVVPSPLDLFAAFARVPDPRRPHAPDTQSADH